MVHLRQREGGRERERVSKCVVVIQKFFCASYASMLKIVTGKMFLMRFRIYSFNILQWYLGDPSGY